MNRRGANMLASFIHDEGRRVFTSKVAILIDRPLNEESPSLRMPGTAPRDESMDSEELRSPEPISTDTTTSDRRSGPTN